MTTGRTGPYRPGGYLVVSPSAGEFALVLTVRLAVVRHGSGLRANPGRARQH